MSPDGSLYKELGGIWANGVGGGRDIKEGGTQESDISRHSFTGSLSAAAACTDSRTSQHSILSLPIYSPAQHPLTPSRMSIIQAEDQLCSYQEAMQNTTYLQDEFPQYSPARGSLRRRRDSRLRAQLLSFEEIREVEEEGSSPTDEEKARKTFLQSLESLRRSSSHNHPQRDKFCNYRLSQDSSDSDSTL